MKKQSFFLFYEKNEMHLKLINMYVNRFIIDEEAENEVMGVYELTKPPEFEFSENRLVRKFQNLLSYNKLMTLCELFKNIEKARERYRFVKDQNFQMHCIFGLSFDFDILFYFLSVSHSTHCSMLWNRSKSFISENDFRPTRHRGSGIQYFVNSLLSDTHNRTIGDDIDHFIDKFRDIKSSHNIWKDFVYEKLIPNKFLNFLKYSNEFDQEFDHLCFSKESEDSHVRIKCQRKFIPRHVHKGRSYVFLIVLCLFILLVCLFAPDWYREITKEIFNLPSDPFNEKFRINICLFWISRLSFLIVEYKCFKKFLEFFHNLVLYVLAVLPFVFPNTWVRIVYILNPLFLCLYFWLFYELLLTRNYYINYYVKPLLEYIIYYIYYIFDIIYILCIIFFIIYIYYIYKLLYSNKD